MFIVEAIRFGLKGLYVALELLIFLASAVLLNNAIGLNGF